MIYNIQLLRLLCAFAVVLAHIVLFGNKKYGLNMTHGEVISYYLMSGVDIFFIISGFVMAFNTKQLEQGQKSLQIYLNNAKHFVIRRAVRIYPIWWLLCICLLPIFILFPAWINSSVEAPTSFIHSFFLVPHEGVPVIVIGWTLEYELFFYICFALTLFLRPATQMMALFGLFISGIIIGLYDDYSHAPLLEIATSPFLLYFLIGMAIAHLYKNSDWKRHFLIAGSVLFIMSVLFAAQFQPNDISRVAHFLPFATSVFIFFLGLEVKNKIFSEKFYKWGGDISYPLYICHILIISAAGRFLMHFGIQFNFIIVIALILLSFIAAHILWIIYDRPIQTYFKKTRN